MKFFKKNQVIIYIIALMLVVAGYLSYTTGDLDKTALVSTEVNEVVAKGNIGDAQLVSGEVVENQEEQSSENKTVDENTVENAVNEQNITSPARKS